jgi:hypothetical protein
MASLGTEPSVPRVAKPWLIGIVVFLALVFGWVATRIPEMEIKSSGGAVAMPLYSVVLFETCWLGLGLACIWNFIVQLCTRLNPSDISQLSLKGVVRLRWGDVVHLSEGYMGTLVLSDGIRSITIASTVYENTDALYAWVHQRLEQSNARAVSADRG